MSDIQVAVAKRQRESSIPKIYKSAVKIWRGARKIISTVRFRNSFYKIYLLINIIDYKMLKEIMTLLFGLEKFIIDTENYLLYQRLK